MTEPTGMGGDLPDETSADETSADETSADETSADERAWAGRVDWPTGPAALTDPLLCPACFAPLVGPVCRRCGLDTGNPASARLAAVSREAAAALDARLGLIGRIRADSARAAAAVALPVPAPADVATDAPADVTRAGRTPAPTEQAPPPATPRPSRAWNVQVILLTIGVSALSVGAIFFLVYAFINFGIVWRSVIIVAITIAAIGASSILARRRLRSTAEGVAAFGVVLVVLDAFAARANDLAGLASIDGPAFWGGTLVLAAAGFALWQRVSGPRIPGVAAVIAFAPGVGLLVFSATDGAPDSWRAWATLLAIATAGLVHPLVPASGTPERAILLGMAVVGLIPALVIAPFVEFSGREQAPSDAVAALVAVGALVGVAAVSAAHLAALRAAPGLPSLFFSAILGLSLGVTGVAAALHTDSAQVSLMAPAVAATVVALALESASGRLRILLIAAAAAAVAAAVCVLVPLTAAVSVVVSTAATPLTAPWSGELDTVLVQRSAESVAAVAALTAIVAVSALAWGHRAFRGDRRRARALAWAGAVLLLLAAPLLETVGAVVVGWFALAATAWFGIHRVRATGAVYRPALVMLLAGAAAAGWATGWASSTTWGAATTFTIALLLSVRILLPGSVEHRRAAPRAALLGTAALLGIQTIGLAVGRLASPGTGFGQVILSAEAVRTSAIASAILLLLAAFAGRVTLGDGARLGPPDRSTLFWISLILAGGGAWAVRVRSLSSTEAVGLLVLTVLLGVGLLAWVGRPRGFLIERMSASLLLAPVLWLLVDTIARLAGATGYLLAVVPVTAAVLTAAGSLAAELVRPASSARLPRGFRDAGAGLVAFVAIGASIATFGEAE
ncbi:MAG: hypothetical protein H7146_13840, partial [Burkholderiaceae bacterium]|nr:hypothetical protein [Microbacteriaceae bacterium]